MRFQCLLEMILKTVSGANNVEHGLIFEATEWTGLLDLCLELAGHTCFYNPNTGTPGRRARWIYCLMSSMSSSTFTSSPMTESPDLRFPFQTRPKSWRWRVVVAEKARRVFPQGSTCSLPGLSRASETGRVTPWIVRSPVNCNWPFAFERPLLVKVI